MANPFLNGDHSELETAILLEQAKQCDLSKISKDYKNAVAFTDGNRVFINDDDNLARILPAYSQGMLKWLLWHERYHIELRHHNRFFKYLEDLDEKRIRGKFKLTKEEVNIIMDILVHDSLSKMFPELVDTATANMAQMRNRNSLKYTFTTVTLEEMLNEYKEHKKDEGEGAGEGSGEGTEDKDGEKSDDKSKGKGKSKSKDKPKDSKDKDKEGTSDGKKGHSEGGDGGTSDKGSDKEDGAPEIKDDEEKPEPDTDTKPEHDKTDWSKLKDIDTREFIDEEESSEILKKIDILKRKKIKLARLTETLNGLATTTKTRTYSVPSYMNLDRHIILKGRRPGRAQLYLCFDASGSMGEQLQLFKEIISKSIPHAMECPCEWFSGRNERVCEYKTDHGEGYFKGTFKDIMPVWASSGFDDDGDRTIELCWQAEQLGYSPIGVTDGGRRISWSKNKLKELKRTILVGQNSYWLADAKKINPHIQTLDI